MRADRMKSNRETIEDLERLLAKRLRRESGHGKRPKLRRDISAFLPPVAHIRRSSGRLWLSRAENCPATTADAVE